MGVPRELGDSVVEVASWKDGVEKRHTGRRVAEGVRFLWVDGSDDSLNQSQSVSSHSRARLDSLVTHGVTAARDRLKGRWFSATQGEVSTSVNLVCAIQPYPCSGL